MRLSLGIALALGLAGSVDAETAVDCPALVGTVESLTGLSIGAPPAGPKDGWCVLDGAKLTGEGAPKITLQTLRIAGTVVEGEVQSLELDAAGLRVVPALGNGDTAEWLRDLMRLQTADLRLSVRRDEAENRLVLHRGNLELSGGSELALMAEIAGAELSRASALRGRLTKLSLEWKNDGRTLRPVLEALGARLKPEVSGVAAVDAARAWLRGLVGAIPDGSLAEGAAEALDAFVLALPQGRGRVTVLLGSDGGIGAAQLGLLALTDDPAGPEALARFLAGTRIDASWTPGLTP